MPYTKDGRDLETDVLGKCAQQLQRKGNYTVKPSPRHNFRMSLDKQAIRRMLDYPAVRFGV